jgi:hypothetical protein
MLREHILVDGRGALVDEGDAEAGASPLPHQPLDRGDHARILPHHALRHEERGLVDHQHEWGIVPRLALAVIQPVAEVGDEAPLVTARLEVPQRADDRGAALDHEVGGEAAMVSAERDIAMAAAENHHGESLGRPIRRGLEAVPGVCGVHHDDLLPERQQALSDDGGRVGLAGATEPEDRDRLGDHIERQRELTTDGQCPVALVGGVENVERVHREKRRDHGASSWSARGGRA